MKNEVSIWANLFLNKQSFDRTKRDVKKSAEGIGEDAGESIASGIEKGLKRSSSRVRRAMEETASATAAHTRAVRELSRLEKDRAAVVAKAIRDEKLYTDAKSTHADITERLRRVEDAHARGRRTLTSATGETIRVERQLSVLRDELSRSTSDLNRTERDYARSKREALRSEKEFLTLSRDAERAIARREQALRRLDSAERKKPSRGGGSGGVVGNMLTDIPFVPSGRAGAVIGGGVLVVLGSVAEAAVTASQSLALLPAITAAAGAGFATLAIGTQGFADAIKDMGDPDKFAEALQSLSPAAQQAALEIQSLVNGPLKALKMATQETLFDGVAQRLHDATGTFGPMLQGLTTSVAGSLNNMFDNLLGELSSANSLASINRIVDDITKAFQNLAPAVAPFTDAILKITETGASFLPGMAQGVTDLANEFSNFITGAQQDGSLANFMQKGIDAAAALGRFILDLGQEIYETFGNTSPEEFASTLDSVKGAVIGIAEAIVGASNAVNDFLGYLTPIADAVGGWENLFQIAIGAFVGVKMASAVSSVLGLANALGMGGGGVAGALKALPGLATAAMGPIALLAAAASSLLITYNGIMNAQQVIASPTDVLPPNATQEQKDIAARGGTNAIADAFPDVFGGGGNTPIPSATTTPGADQFRPHPGRAPFGSGQNPPSSYSPHAVPGPPDTRSDSNRIQDELNKLNPNDYMPSIPGMPSASSGYRNGPDGAGMYEVDPQEVQNAYQRVIEQGRDVRDAHMQLVALQRSGIATDLEILKAKEKVADEQYDFNESQLKLTEAQIGKLEKVNKGMQDIGLALDDDFGASRGLAGLAENLFKFAASMAAAPLLGAMAPIIAQGDGRAGLLGLLPQAPGTGLAASANAYIANAQGGAQGASSYLMPTGGGAAYAGVPLGSNMDVTSQPGLALLRQMGLKGTTYASHTTDGAPTDREVDVWDDGSGAGLARLAEFARQNPGLFEEFIYSDPTTGQKTGIRSGQLVGPGTSQPGYYAKNWAGHQDHAHMEPAKGGGLGGAQEASGSLNALAVAAQSATTALTGGPGGTSLWDKVAQAESGGNWANQDTGKNGHFGGLQFSPETWKAFGGIDLTGQANPANATREEQIEVANRTAFSGYNGQKPQGLGAWEAITSGMVPGVSVNTPASAFGVGGPSPVAPPAVPRGPGWMPQPGVAPTGVASAAQAASGAGTPIGPSGLPLPGSVPTGGPLGTGFPNAFGPGGMPQSPAIGGPGGPLGVGQGIGAPQGGALGQGLGQASASYAPDTVSEAPDPNWTAQGGGGLSSGLIGMAMSAAGSAASMGANAFAPGSGQAAAMGMQMAQQGIERTIKFGSQAVGALVSGAQESLTWRDPDTGEDPLANSWLQRLSGALMGAKPAGSISAAKGDKDSKVDPNAPQNQQQGKDGQQQQGAGPPTVNIEHFTQAENRDGQQAAKDLALNAQTSWFGGG